MRARATLLGDVGAERPGPVGVRRAARAGLGLRRRCRAPRGDPGVGAGARHPGRGRAAPRAAGPRAAGRQGPLRLLRRRLPAGHPGFRCAVAPGRRDPARRTGVARGRDGEVLLGYPDEDGTLPKAPHAPYDRNGTYVVLRSFAVDTAAFRRFVAEADYPAGPNAGRQDRRALAGRYAAGPGAGRPRRGVGGRPEADQRLRLRGRPPGPALPAGVAHPSCQPARRSELFGGRLSARHRIVRRGRAYGYLLPPGAMDHDGADRGLVFVSFSRTSGASSRRSRRSGSTTGTASGSVATPTPWSVKPTRGGHQAHGAGDAAVLRHRAAAAGDDARRSVPLPAVDDGAAPPGRARRLTWRAFPELGVAREARQVQDSPASRRKPLSRPPAGRTPSGRARRTG